MTPHTGIASHWDYRFAEFKLCLSKMELQRPSGSVRLEPKTFALLVYLLANRGRVVKKQELLDRVWGGIAVCDGALTQCVSSLRKVLGESARSQSILRTYPRVGYRFVCPVETDRAGDGARLPVPMTGNANHAAAP